MQQVAELGLDLDSQAPGLDVSSSLQVQLEGRGKAGKSAALLCSLTPEIQPLCVSPAS